MSQGRTRRSRSRERDPSRPRTVIRPALDRFSCAASHQRLWRELASAGLSNPAIAQELFITRKTVEKHLSNVYLKLDISSRERLPALLAAGGHDS
jgi:DNA-binding NarL/FixJ family response regulator